MESSSQSVGYPCLLIDREGPRGKVGGRFLKVS